MAFVLVIAQKTTIHLKKERKGIPIQFTDFNTMDQPKLNAHDALLIVDVQKDFLPGGAFAVPEEDKIIPLLNQYTALFKRHGLPIIATRDWHPPDHCSFKAQGAHGLRTALPILMERHLNLN